MQEDVYQGDGLNLYAYCGNNPVMYYDPSGFTALDEGGYYVYGLFDINAETPYYIGITNDTKRRSGEHAASGRLNIEPTDDYPIPGVLRALQSNVTYGEARGYEQYYIDKYGTRTGTIGEEISQDNRGNKYNSYNRERTDERAQCYEETYKRQQQEDEGTDTNKGGSGCES